MNCGLRVAMPPPKPLLVYDGDCHFCTLWVRRGQQLTGDTVNYLPAQDPRIAEQFPEIPQSQFAEAVQYVGPDGTVCSGAEAVFRTLAHHPGWQWPWRGYAAYPVLAGLMERAYRFVAGHRPWFSALTRWGWGRHVEAPSHFLVRWFFLRGLGVVYFFAFLSLWTQVNGLIGHNGILPVDQYLPAIKQQCDARGMGLERYHLLPTLCWFDTSNAFLDFQCAAGTMLAVLLFLGLAPAPCLALLWVLYLSLVTVGRDFLGFQWDNLLLEAGLLAVFLAPLPRLPRLTREGPPSRLAIWLLRLLLFKLVFLSGCVKLLSGDPTWRHLTALTFHYQTQPLPTWIGWYAHQLPLWFQKLSCALTLGVEIGAPFLMLGPRRVRFAGGTLIAGLQVLILLTGNYTFFNWLTLALCLLLLDDFVVAGIGERARLGRCWMRPRIQQSGRAHSGKRGGFVSGHEVFREGAENSVRGGRAPRWPRPLLVTVAVVWLGASVFLMADTLGQRSGWLTPLGWVAEELEPFRSVNDYGLFRVMTTERNEIVVEGSNDGVNWRAYEFKYKPGDLNRRPGFVAPLQPRLDWQMWFAALGSVDQNPWFEGFCERLLQGSPDVLALLAVNPFPEHPPRFIRAELYNYQFANFAERRATGGWWRRTLVGEYLPPVSLKRSAE